MIWKKRVPWRLTKRNAHKLSVGNPEVKNLFRKHLRRLVYNIKMHLKEIE
jgi:hypothetical protein